MKCPRCQYENPLGSNFCLGCGTRLGATCGACGNDLPAGSRFCNKCGTPVSGEPATQEGRFASPESYTPQHLAERILTSKSALEGSVGDAYDNALCESFFATLECELLDRQRFPTQADARLAVFDFIEGWYNPRRRHSALDYLSPMMFERTHSISDRTVPSGSTIEPGGAILVSPLGVGAVSILESSSPSTEPGQLQPGRKGFLFQGISSSDRSQPHASLLLLAALAN